MQRLYWLNHSDSFPGRRREQAKTGINLVVLVTTAALIWTIISQVIVFIFSRERLKALKSAP